MDDFSIWIFLISVIILVGCIILVVCLGTYLWNCLMVAVFGLPALTKAQFFGLMLLVRILFGYSRASLFELKKSEVDN